MSFRFLSAIREGDVDFLANSDIVPLALLALQFGVQPTLNKAFISNGVSSTVLIIVTEVVKIILSLIAIVMICPKKKYSTILGNWNLHKATTRAGVPAALYSFQNWLILFGSKRISALSMSLLNQTKTLSAALFSYLLLGKVQSRVKIVALGGLFIGAGIIVDAERKDGVGKSVFEENESRFLGFAAVALASLLSGLSSAISEQALATPLDASLPKLVSSLVFSIELAVLGISTLLVSIISGINADTGLTTDPFRGWSMFTLIPVLCNATGGILVGVVTQRAGGVKKGFALVAGICVATIIETVLGTKSLTLNHLLAASLVAASMWLYFSPEPVRVKSE